MIHFAVFRNASSQIIYLLWWCFVSMLRSLHKLNTDHFENRKNHLFLKLSKISRYTGKKYSRFTRAALTRKPSLFLLVKQSTIYRLFKKWSEISQVKRFSWYKLTWWIIVHHDLGMRKGVARQCRNKYAVVLKIPLIFGIALSLWTNMDPSLWLRN